MNAYLKNAVLVAALLGMICQANAQQSPNNAPIRWKVAAGSNSSKQVRVKSRRGNVQLNLRDPAARFQLKETSKATQIAEKRAAAQSTRQTQAAKPLTIPHVLAQRQSNVNRPAAFANKSSHVQHPATLVAPRHIRLVQAAGDETDVEDLLKDLDNLVDQSDGSSDSIDDLLEQAKDIVQQNQADPGVDAPMEDSTGDSLDLDSLAGPESTEDSQDPEEMREKLKRELDRLLDDEADEDDPLGLTDDSDDEDEEELKAKEAEEQAYINKLVDPVPDAAYRNRYRTRRAGNMPYTLSNILGEEDRYDPNCVAEYCRQVWQCAGGRCLSPIDRLRRNINRDRMVRNAGCGAQPCNPMKNYRCPKCPNIQPTSGMQSYAPAVQDCPPGDIMPDAEFQPFGGTIGESDYSIGPDTPSTLPLSEAPVEAPPLGLLEPVEDLPADSQ